MQAITAFEGTRPAKGASVARVSSVALVGMEARHLEVEAVMGGGVPDMNVVGLPGSAVREAKRRVRAAIESSGLKWPQSKKVTVSLAPGDLRKEGALLDLAIAVAILVANGTMVGERLPAYLLMGELALDGRIRPVRGALAAALSAKSRKRGLILPRANASEGALVSEVETVAAETLSDVIAFLEGGPSPSPVLPPAFVPREWGHDLEEVRGQALAKRALEIAAAGSHNVLLVGPPGAGKTMLARRLPGILPLLSLEESLETTRVWSVAGLLPERDPLIRERPFRGPHHSASPASIIGGGSPYPRPGEISLAHNGVLFFDEMPLFSRSVLEGLRQPLEDGEVTIARQGATVRFPARVSLVAAANPCPCGNFGDRRTACTCSLGRLESYRSRLSGPLLDRFDLFVEVPRLNESDLLGIGRSEPSKEVRHRVMAARERRDSRLEAELPRSTRPTIVQRVADLSGPARLLLSRAMAAEAMSARAVERTVRVVRTIADLEGSIEVVEAHVAEALQFRRSAWEFA